MATTNDLKNGLVLNLDGELWSVVEFQHVKPGKGPAFVRTKLKHVLSGKVVDKTFNAGIKVETASVDGKYVTVRVKDEGAGIAKTELKQIFKRFYRAPGPLATRVKGTGLGLFIVRSVAKRHGGRAWAESEGPGRGSTFVLQLPIVQ